MKECVREHEITEAVISGRWPDACDKGLLSHASACAVCKDVVAVACALHDEHARAVTDARVPSAGLVWWRAELRARQEAARAAERPITVAHSMAAAAAIGVTMALIVSMLPSVRELLTAFTGLPDLYLLTGALVTLLVVASVALYVVFSE